MRHIFIVNPVAGKADATKFIIPKILRAIRELQFSEQDYEIRATGYPGHAREMAESYAKSGEALCLYACGGDGTLHEVINGAYGYPNVSVCSVPCGSGNDFVRNFGNEADFTDIASLINGETVFTDLMQVGEDKAATICSAGLDAQVAHGIGKFRRLPFCGGTMAYNLSILTEILKPLGHKLRLEIDGATIEEKFLMVAICNGCAYGGGYLAAPESFLNDGMLDIVLVKKISRLRIASVVGAYKKGEHIKQGVVQPALQDAMCYIRGKEIKVTALDGKPIVLTQDGECHETMSFSVRVLPQATKVRIPAVLAGSCHLQKAALTEK